MFVRPPPGKRELRPAEYKLSQIIKGRGGLADFYEGLIDIRPFSHPPPNMLTEFLETPENYVDGLRIRDRK